AGSYTACSCTAAAGEPGGVLVLLPERARLLSEGAGVPRRVGQGAASTPLGVGRAALGKKEPQMSRSWIVLAAGVALLGVGCATVPTGPSVMVLPGTGKPFEQFQADDAMCRQWAMQQAGLTQKAFNDTTISGAAIGTVLGAAAGAAFGALAGNPALGAAAGAGAGLLGGTAIGAGYGEAAAGSGRSRPHHPPLPGPS